MQSSVLLSIMSRSATSIELVGLPEAGLTAVTQASSVHTKDDGLSYLPEDRQPINAPVSRPLEKRTTAIVLVTVVAVTMISSMLSGVTTIALPTMARDLQLAPSVLLW